MRGYATMIFTDGLIVTISIATDTDDGREAFFERFGEKPMAAL